MARIWMSGFEGGSLGVLTTVAGNTAVVSTYARTGTYSLYIPTIAANSHGQKNLGAGYNELYMRFGLRHNGTSIGAGGMIRLYDSGGTVQISLCVAADGTLSVIRGTLTGGTVIVSGGVLPADEWHCVEWYAKIADSGGRSIVKLDGTIVQDFTGDTRNAGVADIQTIQFGANSTVQGVNFWADDVAINSTSGAVNNSYPGQGGIYGIVPSAAGNYTQLTPSAGDNYACVDEAPPNDATDYVGSATTDKKDSYAMGNVTPTGGTVLAVNVLLRARLSEAGTGAIARLLRIASTDYQGSDRNIDVSWTSYGEILETSPATAVAWTIAEVNGLEAGVVVR